MSRPHPDNDHIQRLLPRHFKILEYTLAGHDPDTIAKSLEITRATVYMVQRSPLFQAELVRRRTESNEAEIIGLDRQATLGKARSILEEASIAAAEKHVELLQDQDSSIQLRSAQAILDRAMGKTGDGNVGMVVNISAEHVNLLNLALRESAA